MKVKPGKDIVKNRDKHKWLMKDTPECEVPCGYCGDIIVFAEFTDSTCSEYRAVPTYHTYCARAVRKNNIIKKAEKLAKLRGKTI